jgi:hypothetical protein
MHKNVVLTSITMKEVNTMTATTKPKSVLSLDRLNSVIAQSREKCEALEPEKLTEIDKTLDLQFDEWFEFQQLQAQAHAMGRLETDAAQLIYRSLNGEHMSQVNGGWAKGVDTATKFIITQLMGELLSLKIKGRF